MTSHSEVILTKKNSIVIECTENRLKGYEPIQIKSFSINGEKISPDGTNLLKLREHIGEECDIIIDGIKDKDSGVILEVYRDKELGLITIVME